MSVEQFIDGRWQKPGGGASFETRNPSNLSQVTGEWPAGNRTDADAAIAAAEAAYGTWRRKTVHERADLFARVIAAMDRRREEIARQITIENGKTLKDSHAEIQSAYREMQYQVAEGVRLAGRMQPSARPGVFAYETRVPLGVVAVISPWNFPFNVPCRKITPALMAGNTCVFKPASLTPGVGRLFVELFEEAGFPAGVVNMVIGGGSTVGAALTESSAIRAVSFTGSTEVGTGIHRAAADKLIRTQLEMGGKNAVVVLEDADLDAAAEATVLAAYACAGQWCTSTSRAVVCADVYDRFVSLVLERCSSVTVGDGLAPETVMGPVCGAEQFETVQSYLELGRSEGARLIAGTIPEAGSTDPTRCLIEPAVFADVTPSMRIAQEEIFGPVLSVLKVSDFDEALRIANDVPFGLSSSIYTRDLPKAMRFVNEIETGVTHVNMMTAYKEPGFAFGGVKQSGAGVPEAGSSGIAFFTEHKTVYIDHGVYQ